MGKKIIAWGTCFLLLQIVFVACVTANDPVVVFWDTQTDVKVNEQGATVAQKDGELFVTTGTTTPWPGFNMQGNWKLAPNSEMVLVLTNHGKNDITLHCRLDSPRPSENMRNVVTKSESLAVGETKEWRFQLPAKLPEEFQKKFFAMRGTPFGMSSSSNDSTFDPEEISQLILFVNQPSVECRWSVKQIVAEPSKASDLAAIPIDEFFPMIDKYGQFTHRDWSGKIKSDDDLQKAIAAEKADLAANPAPKDRNKYGGWTAGPKLKATGHFRTEKIDGKWWLVDPEGCLFWSHGTDCVITGNASTPITDREFYFAELPPNEGLFASCYGTGNWAPHNYYEGRGTYRTFDFSKANIIRKYGENWAETYNNLVHERLRSWGMNTIANWSSPQFYRMQRTPYTETLNITAQPIRGSEGYWGQFVDPFDPQFRETIKASSERAARTTGNDPWCIGYFVQNEISWGSETSLALAALMSPADQPAKNAVIDHLKEKYDSIEKLNAAWQSKYASWDTMRQSTEKPNEKAARNDLLDCYRLIADQYFRVIKSELQNACPNKLYLGCRFAWGNDIATVVAADYCDVISFNKYQYSLATFDLPKGIDKPCLIGEFHFGALDRGMFHTGLCPVESQDARAAAYEKYVASALENPYLVGTHWFQYMDQATTGRGDGENYQIGLVTSCDSPYPETIAAVRKIGRQMYELRSKTNNKTK